MFERPPTICVVALVAATALSGSSAWALECFQDDFSTYVGWTYTAGSQGLFASTRTHAYVYDWQAGSLTQAGKPKRIDAQYRHCGAASVFMLNVPLEGMRHVRVRQHRMRTGFAEVVRELCDELYAHAEKILLVLDDLNAHSTALFYEAFEPAEERRLAEKLEIHHTPKHGSWLNMAEIELSILSRQSMNDYFQRRGQLADAIARWERSRNERKAGIDWRFTTADARTKPRKLYPTV